MTADITHILVPTDFSEHSSAATAYAGRLAERLGASVELLHVVEDPVLTGTWSPEIFVPNVSDLLEGFLDDARAKLAVIQRTIPDTVPRSTAAIVGPVARTIADYAAEGGFNLIVIGTHGRTGLSHALLGSVAERVLRTAPCAVLTVKLPVVAHTAPALALAAVVV